MILASLVGAAETPDTRWMRIVGILPNTLVFALVTGLVLAGAPGSAPSWTALHRSLAAAGASGTALGLSWLPSPYCWRRSSCR